MNKLIQYILIIYGFSYSQALIPTLYKMKDFAFDTTAYKGLKSNMISDIVQQGDTVVWLGTGSGLAVLKDSTSMYTINSTENLSANLKDKTPVGGVTAIAAYNKTLIAAFAKSGENITLGNGLIYTLDATGESIDWTYFEQPIDTEKDSLAPFAKKYFKGLPITVKEANVTYDAAITKDYIWIASWAGGLRRYNLALKIWERVPLPQDGDQVLNTCEKASYENNILKDYYLNPRDPVDGGNHNHKAFSVVAYADTVWVGTANGINRGIIGALGCVDWVHYTSANNGLSGGFVVDLAVQQYKGYNIIWGATVAAETGEKNGVSFTVDDGYTWNSTLIGKRAYNIDASGSIVLVASSSGLWKTLTDNPLDIDKPWARYNQAKQAIKLGSTGVYDMDEILSD